MRESLDLTLSFIAGGVYFECMFAMIAQSAWDHEAFDVYKDFSCRHTFIK